METQIIHSHPVLHAEASKGTQKYWQIHVHEGVGADSGRYFTNTTSWRETKDGLSKVVPSALSEVVGVNVGRSNETTNRAQVFLEAESEFKRYKARKGYLEEGEAPANTFVLPMLAHKYKDRKDKDPKKGGIDWSKGNYAQPKKDGCRFMMNSSIGTAWSRQGVEFHPALVSMFMFDTAGYTLDGELMMPEGYSQQQLMSIAATIDKKNLKPQIPLLEFHVFDIVDDTLPFPERLVLLKEILSHAPEGMRIKMLETRFVATPQEFQEYHEVWCAKGDEGSILRDGSSPYKIKHRSNSLLKHKDFLDDEFTVIDVVDGTGKFVGMAMFKCLTHDGKEFDVTPRGAMSVKAEMFENKHKYIGEKLTVQFQKYSDKGKPIFPTGIAIRDMRL